MAPKILFVVRDGALVEQPAGEVRDALAALRLVEGVIPALLRLCGAGYELVVLAEEAAAKPTGRERNADEAAARPSGRDRDAGAAPGIPPDPGAHGIAHDREREAFLQALFASQGIRFAAVLRCPHGGADRACGCLRPGVELVREYLPADAMDRERSAVVGASAVDLEFAKNVGLRGFLLGGDSAGRVTTWAAVDHALLDRPRKARVLRKTRETEIRVELDLDREAEPRIATGIAFFDHMLEQLGKHGGFELAVSCRGDLEVDEHHTVEDVALALGQALRQALGDKRGIQRYGFVLPMDEAEAEISLDLGGRPYLVFEGAFPRDRVGGLPTELVPHFFRSLTETLGAALHVKLHGENAHHMVEAAFKGVARTLRQACARSGEALPTTKGLL
ncbi:MAG TPA: imidazoleglycerol-phosphate dehydratase HisB [Gammaproteobacteria bacterium]|nr:imidazoleglycerol-phosphate dehydratase HisB [Gammaproteobacteria bacterium]